MKRLMVLLIILWCLLVASLAIAQTPAPIHRFQLGQFGAGFTLAAPILYSGRYIVFPGTRALVRVDAYTGETAIVQLLTRTQTDPPDGIFSCPPTPRTCCDSYQFVDRFTVAGQWIVVTPWSAACWYREGVRPGAQVLLLNPFTWAGDVPIDEIVPGAPPGIYGDTAYVETSTGCRTINLPDLGAGAAVPCPAPHQSQNGVAGYTYRTERRIDGGFDLVRSDVASPTPVPVPATPTPPPSATETPVPPPQPTATPFVSPCAPGEQRIRRVGFQCIDDCTGQMVACPGPATPTKTPEVTWTPPSIPPTTTSTRTPSPSPTTTVTAVPPPPSSPTTTRTSTPVATVTIPPPTSTSIPTSSPTSTPTETPVAPSTSTPTPGPSSPPSSPAAGAGILAAIAIAATAAVAWARRGITRLIAKFRGKR